MIHDHHPEDRCVGRAAASFPHQLGVIRYRHPNMTGPDPVGGAEQRICGFDRQTWPCETIEAIALVEGMEALIAEADREASLAHDFRVNVDYAHRADLDACIFRLHDLLRPMLTEVPRRPKMEQPCQRGSNPRQGIDWHWCTTHDAELPLNAATCGGAGRHRGAA